MHNDGIRRHDGKVFVCTAQPKIAAAARVSAVDQGQHSKVGEIVNGISHQRGRLASYEPGLWRLDGSFMLPVEHFGSEVEVGYISNSVSDEGGFFALPPQIDIRFDTPQDIECVTLCFDGALGEFCAEVRVAGLNSAGRAAFDETIRGNTEFLAATSIGGRDVVRVVISILRTANPRRRARIAEVHFGHVLMFGGEDILEVNNMRQADIMGRSLPPNRLRARVLNKGRFSLLEPAGNIRHLSQRMAVEHVHGIIEEGRALWQHCGNFALDSWTVREGHIDFLAYGQSRGLAEATYLESAFSLWSLADMARHVAADAGLEVLVADIMERSPGFLRFFGNVNHRAALTAIAQLASCVVYEDNMGRLCFADILGPAGDLADNLSYDKLFSQPKIERRTYYNGVLLRERTMKVQSGSQVVSLDIRGTQDVVIPFDAPVFSGGWATVSGGFSMSNMRFFPMYMTARISGNGTCNVTVSGNRASFADIEVFYPAPWKKLGEEEHPYVVKLPMFLHNIVNMAAMRQWFLQRKFAMMARRMVCECGWRQNTALGIGDAVSMQVDRDGRQVVGYVTRQDLAFARGVLRGSSHISME